MSEIKKLSPEEIQELSEIAKRSRYNIIKMIHNAASGHCGGSLSAVEILTTLYFKCLNHYKEWKNHPEWENRDRFILSKGHASAIFYSTLAESGYFCSEELMTFRKLHSKLQGHPCCSYLDGVEVSTGSLGQGLSIACGMALGLKLDNKQSRVYILHGDGELQEGQIWEAAMNASHHKLGNITAIVDRNKLQIDGCTENVKGLDPLNKKWEAFGWQVIEIDGHDYNQIYEAIETSKIIGPQNNQPVVIIADTIKGKGVSFMENNPGWHGKAPNDDQCELALKELS